MRLFRGRTWLLVVLILGLSACEGAASGHTSSGVKQSPPARVTATPDPERCARLAKRGFTPCPPTPDKMQLPPTTIRNATNGAINDATAQQWGRAFQLAQAYYYWAMQNGARSALTSGILADANPNAVTNLFGTDLQDLDAAANVGGKLVYEPPGIPNTQVVVVPMALQDAMRRQGLTPKGVGVAVRLVGPTRRAIQLADGGTKPIASADATYRADVLTWGELRGDPDLGPIWFEYGYYGCDGSVRSVCQL